MATDTTRLLRGVKRRITQPAYQGLLDDPAMLELADDVIKDKMVPLVLSTRQDYFVVKSTTTVTDGVSEYDIPYRALGRGLRDIKYSFDGTDTGIKNLVKIALEDEHLMARTGDPIGFYFRGDKVCLCPTPDNSSQYIQWWWELPPSSLVLTSAAALISSVSVGSPNTTITINGTIPSTMVATTSCDVIQGKSGNSTLAMDISIQSATSSTLVFTATDLPTTPVAGDWVALAGQSPVVQLPDTCYPLFETEVCARILFSVGDFEGQAGILSKGADQEKQLLKVLEPRIQGEPTKIVNRNGLLRRGNVQFWRGRGFYG